MKEEIEKLMWKALCDEKSLTPKERHDVYLEMVSTVLNFSTLADLRKLRTAMRKDPTGAIAGVTCNCGCDYGAVMLDMVEGKITLRELGTIKMRQIRHKPPRRQS